MAVRHGAIWADRFCPHLRSCLKKSNVAHEDKFHVTFFDLSELQSMAPASNAELTG
jgi:hypothetical protein